VQSHLYLGIAGGLFAAVCGPHEGGFQGASRWEAVFKPRMGASGGARGLGGVVIVDKDTRSVAFLGGLPDRSYALERRTTRRCCWYRVISGSIALSSGVLYDRMRGKESAA